MTDAILSLADSWQRREGVNSTAQLLEWVSERNKNLKVEIRREKLSDDPFWYYDERSDTVCNRKNSFFSVSGLRWRDGEKSVCSQPTMIQDEIGYLGILCAEIGGAMHLLMQAKIEPGNVNKIQLSPTIQATKSNFTRAHGGREPAYLSEFRDAAADAVVFDQIQSEQSSRFLKKRNRNIMVLTGNPPAESADHRWMTLGQIKELMRRDNLVNMDTRTVLSCIPFCAEPAAARCCGDTALARSLSEPVNFDRLKDVFRFFNDYRMFSPLRAERCGLSELDDWVRDDSGMYRPGGYAFRMIYCDISIEGREVTHWTQPMFAAEGPATFALAALECGGTLRFVVKARPEIGCFDGIELGPTLQMEYGAAPAELDEVERRMLAALDGGGEPLCDVMLSEEGGRFYCEQNRNAVLKLAPQALGELPRGWFALTFRELNMLAQQNNVLNIQLRNLLSLLEA